MRLLILAATFAALSLVSTVTSQQVSGGVDPDRRSSTLMIATDRSELLAGVAISYTPAIWQESYDGLVEQPKAVPYTRLGKGWWATFETVGPLEIGGTKIEPGSYYLGLAVDKGGSFSLLVLDSKLAMKSGLLPGTTALYRGQVKAEARVPLALAKGSQKAVVAKLEIEITADKKDPATGRFSIRWGKHELSAPVRFHLALVNAIPDAKR